MTTSKRDYTKDIIEEYNIRLQSWDHSDSWGLTEFKMLEDLIYESSNTRINANTLKRFFQQKTSNPQVATYNALCVFLGYSNYAEFIMKKTQQFKVQSKDEDNGKTADIKDIPVRQEDVNDGLLHQQELKKKSSLSKYSQISIYFIIIAVVVALGIYGYWDTFKAKYENRLISSVVFESSLPKGASPFTTKIKYDIPSQLIDSMSIVCVEANGDQSARKLSSDKNEVYATFIYPGKGICHLKYKDKYIRTISVESRAPGWSVYLKEERNDVYRSFPFSSVDAINGYLTLPLHQVKEDIVKSDKLFITYTYYADSIIDGDNFIFEARVRNSTKEDNAIPCNDIMMYIFSDTNFHGFALNENCYSYLKFISGENTIMGDQHDLSRLNFNPELWHVMKIEVKDMKTNFYLDGEIVNQMTYTEKIGTANELTLRFKGFGAVEYVKVMKPDGELVYEKDWKL